MAHAIRCGKGHTHPSTADVRSCYMTPPAPPVAPSVSTGERPHVVHTSAPPTDKQRATVASLGGVLAPDATRLEASRVIDALIAAKRRATPEPVRRATRMQQSRLGIPMPMLQQIREGRFAVSMDGTERLKFLRISTIKPPKKGHRAFVGWIKVQTQHSSDLIDRAVISPEGEVRMLSATLGMTELTGYLLGIITDQRRAAILYGQKLHHCCSCGKELTDERSRYYGIGPECEKKWPEVIDEVDEMQGVFQPGQVLVN